MPCVWVQSLKETSSRVAKWKEKLAAYSFKIVHVKGKKNVIADFLSRSVGVQELDDKHVTTPQGEAAGQDVGRER